MQFWNGSNYYLGYTPYHLQQHSLNSFCTAGASYKPKPSPHKLTPSPLKLLAYCAARNNFARIPFPINETLDNATLYCQKCRFVIPINAHVCEKDIKMVMLQTDFSREDAINMLMNYKSFYLDNNCLVCKHSLNYTEHICWDDVRSLQCYNARFKLTTRQAFQLLKRNGNDVPRAAVCLV